MKNIQINKKLYNNKFEKIKKIGEGSYGCVYISTLISIIIQSIIFITYFKLS